MNFAFISRVMRLVAFSYILHASSFQQVMASYASSHQQSRMNSATASTRSTSRCWITLAEYENYIPSIFSHIVLPEWMFLLLLCVGTYFFTTFVVQRLLFKILTLEQKLKESQAQCHSLTENNNQLKLYKMKIEHQHSFMKTRMQFLVQEISNLNAELDKFRPHIRSLVSHRDRVASMASGPANQVPTRSACVPVQTDAVALMAAVVPSAPKPTVQGGHRSKDGRTFQRANNNQVVSISKNDSGGIHSKEEKYQGGIHSKEEKYQGGIHSKEEKYQGGRPVPGSSSFIRDARIDVSSASARKILSGDYLTFYMGNLSYRANDTNLKAAIEKRLSVPVDQVVVAYSSDGKSRGCAFVTVRWSDYLKSQSNFNAETLVHNLCSSLTGKPLFGRPVFVELASSQRRGG
jgi:hypothetical protein